MFRGFLVVVLVGAYGCGAPPVASRQKAPSAEVSPASDCTQRVHAALARSKELEEAGEPTAAATTARAALDPCAVEGSVLSEELVELMFTEARAELAALRYDRARSAVLTMKAHLERTGRAKSLWMFRGLVLEGHVELGSSHPEAAVAPLARAAELPRELQVEPTTEAAALWPLGSAYVQTQRTEQAIPLLLRAQSLVRPGSEFANRTLLSTKLTLWRAYQHSGDREASVETLESIAPLLDLPGSEAVSRRAVLDALLELASHRDASKQHAEAEPLRARARRLAETVPSLAPHRLRVDVASLDGLIEAGDLAAVLELMNRHGGYARRLDTTTDRIEVVDLVAAVNDATPRTGGVAASSAPQESGGANAAAVVAALQPHFRGCYLEALDADAKAEGLVRLSFHVGANGRVERAFALVLKLPESATACVLRHAGRAVFDRPAGGKATIIVPISFVKL